MMAVRVFFVVCCVLVIFCKNVSGCTSGFMEMDVLRERAVKIPDGDRSDEGLENEFRLISDISFTCSGIITSLQLGGTVRGGGMRNIYPEIQLWRPNTGGAFYTQQASQEIRLAEGDFSPDGVLRYNLTTHIQFQSGDVLGVYQPEVGRSVVRIYYNSEVSTTYQLGSYPTGPISFESLSFVSNQKILISPITDPPSCSSNFLSLTDLHQKVLAVNINRVRRRERDQRLFPDIHFTCNGFITKWIVGATISEDLSNADRLPELQVWQSDGGSSFTKRNFSIFPITNVPQFTNVYEYMLTSPLEFQEGDILGVYQPRQGDSQLVVYYQEDDGPGNYRQNGLDTAPSTFTLMDVRDFDYPLVTVEISTPVTMVSTTQSEPTIAATVTTGPPLAPPVLTSGSTRMDLLLPSVSMSASVSLTEPGRGGGGGEYTAIIAGIVAIIVLLFLISVIVVALIVIIIAWRKRSHKDFHLSHRRNTKKDLDTLNNPIYGDEKSVESFAESTQQHYSMAGHNEQVYSVPDTGNTPYYEASHYDLPQHNYDALCKTTGNSTNTIPCHYSTYEWGIVVPTLNQRNRLGSIPENSSENVYASLAETIIRDDAHVQQLSFFEETAVYWEPGSDCGSIYEQLAKRKFREIIRQQINPTGHLGSGHFGNVDKGMWHSPGGLVEVAIKTLRVEASEKEKVKFLQEAAIMGQFHHPNIVKLHGVVTMGNPVMIVLELMKYGDLKQYLTSIRPVPGEMAPSSLPQQLLGYCRQIASGMEYLSKKSFVHRDLAARNILVDDKRTCKIADFGMSRDLQDENYYVSSGGQVPVKWTAPEALHYKKYSTSSDVWSFGVLMYEIWSLGHKPFEGCTNPQALRKLHDGYRLPPPPGCMRPIYQLMIQCWHPETSGRPSFASLVSRLSQPENQLLKWTDRNKNVTHSQSTMLGAPLETASNLYSDLQNTYM